MVLYSVVQSVEHPRRMTAFFMMPMYLLTNCLQSLMNSAGGISVFVMPYSSSVSTSVGRPWQSHPCGNRTLYPRMRLYRATMSK